MAAWGCQGLSPLGGSVPGPSVVPGPTARMRSRGRDARRGSLRLRGQGHGPRHPPRASPHAARSRDKRPEIRLKSQPMAHWESTAAAFGALHTRRVLLVVSLLSMETKQVVRQFMQLAYAPRVAAKWSRNRSAYFVGWLFDATIVVLLVAFATLYFAT